MSAFVHDSLRLLFDVSLRSIILALLAAGLLWLFRVTDHNVRHRVWCMVLAAMFFLPLAQLVSPAIRLPVTAASLFDFSWGRPTERATKASGDAIESAYLPKVDPTIDGERGLSATSASHVSNSDDGRTGVVAGGAEPLIDRPDPLSWKTVIFAVYAIVAVALIARLVAGMWAARRLTQRSRRIDPALIGGRIAFECDAIQVPLTTGFVSPRILLPADWQSWNGDLLQSVLNHEQAHLLRRDNLITVLGEANRCLYWFHPLAWLLRRELAVLAEFICDDYAIAAAPDRRQYAQHLLEIAGRLTGGVRRASGVDIFMARTPQVVSRIDSILDASRPLTRRLSRSGSALLTIVAIPLMIGAAGLRAGEPPETSSATSERAPADSVAEAATPQAGHDIYGDPLPEGAISRLGTIRLRQPGQGWRRIAFLPGGSQFIVGGLDCDARCWDARTGEMIHKFDLNGAQPSAFCVSPADGAVATLGVRFKGDIREADSEVIVWNSGSWSERQRIAWKGSLGPKSMAFSPDGKTLAVSEHDGGLRLLSVEDQKKKVLKGPSLGPIESLAFSPEGDLIVTASRQGVLCWNLVADEEPQRLEEFPQGAGVVRFSPDGRLLAVGAYGSPAMLYDVKSRKPLVSVHARKPVLSITGGGDDHSTEGMCFSADGNQLIIPSRKNVIEFFDVKTGKLVKSLESQPIQPQGVDVSPQGEFAACIGTAAAIDVWNLKSGKRISDQWIGNLDATFQTLFTLNDEQVITGGRDGSIRFWNAATGRQERILQHDRWVAALALSPRGESLLSLGLDDTVRLWDAATGTEKLKLPGHGMTGGSGTSALAFSPDGKQFYSFGMDLVLRINETATGKALAEHDIRPSDVKIESGPDGRPLPDLGDPFAEGKGGFQFDQVVLTAGGSHLLIGGRTTSKIYLFDCETGRETAIFKTENPLQGLAVSPDGSLIATFEDDNPPQEGQPGPRRRSSTLRLRDIASQKIVREVKLPGGYAYRMAFSNDGKLLSLTTSQIDMKTYSQRTRLSVLNVETLKEVAGMDVEPNSIRTMAFAHGGTILGTGYADSSVLLWDLEKLRDNGSLPR